EGTQYTLYIIFCFEVNLNSKQMKRVTKPNFKACLQYFIYVQSILVYVAYLFIHLNEHKLFSEYGPKSNTDLILFVILMTSNFIFVEA
ncbi:hypothetical protein L9F63_006031, partial [Diploptera punctata]